MIQKHIKAFKKKIVKTHLFNLITARLHQAQRRKELKELVGSLFKKYQMEPMEKSFADKNFPTIFGCAGGKVKICPRLSASVTNILENSMQTNR